SLTGNVVESNFADVSANTVGLGSLSWNVFGFYKGSITPASNVTIFDVTVAPGYTGDIVTTLTLGNADQLAKIYKIFALQIQAVDVNTGDAIDISAGNGQKLAMLTLDNGSCSLFTAGAVPNISVQVKGGFFISHAHPLTGWPSGASASPQIFAEVAQR
ncbi:MAG TPA: hypothetical protein VMB24_00800, partial [Dehalococcoidales bacterium]|nr:hypothetical protein [Dehalococcoidales bacterium]